MVLRFPAFWGCEWTVSQDWAEIGRFATTRIQTIGMMTTTQGGSRCSAHSSVAWDSKNFCTCTTTKHEHDVMSPTRQPTNGAKALVKAHCQPHVKPRPFRFGRLLLLNLGYASEYDPPVDTDSKCVSNHYGPVLTERSFPLAETPWLWKSMKPALSLIISILYQDVLRQTDVFDSFSSKTRRLRQTNVLGEWSGLTDK